MGPSRARMRLPPLFYEIQNGSLTVFERMIPNACQARWKGCQCQRTTAAERILPNAHQARWKFPQRQ